MKYPYGFKSQSKYLTLFNELDALIGQIGAIPDNAGIISGLSDGRYKLHQRVMEELRTFIGSGNVLVECPVCLKGVDNCAYCHGAEVLVAKKAVS